MEEKIGYPFSKNQSQKINFTDPAFAILHQGKLLATLKKLHSTQNKTTTNVPTQNPAGSRPQKGLAVRNRTPNDTPVRL